MAILVSLSHRKGQSTTTSTANEVTEVSKKKAILLTVVGPQQFRLLKDLTAPEKPADKSYDALCMLLKQHHEPEPPKFLQRTKFDARPRKDNESISECVAALRKFSEHCQFRTTLNERLCERFVTGVNNNAIQRKLLLETDLTLDKAVTIAISISQTNEGAKALESGQVHVMSNKFKSNSSKQSHYRHGNGQPRPSRYLAIAAEVPICRTVVNLRALHATSVQNKDIIQKLASQRNIQQPPV